MPYVFQYAKDTGEEVFRCNLTCARCSVELKNGNRCARTVCIGLPLCWQHLLTSKNDKHGMKIKHSAISGLGLFAWSKNGGHDVVYKAGDTITTYDGERLTQAELDQRYGDDTAPYAFGTGNGIIDAACKRGAGSVANGARHGVRPNARYASRMEGGVRIVRVKATKTIKHGQEIVCDYRKDYWEYAKGKHSTKRRSQS